MMDHSYCTSYTPRDPLMDRHQLPSPIRGMYMYCAVHGWWQPLVVLSGVGKLDSRPEAEPCLLLTYKLTRDTISGPGADNLLATTIPTGVTPGVHSIIATELLYIVLEARNPHPRCIGPGFFGSPRPRRHTRRHPELMLGMEYSTYLY